jgi:hypothetical protein
MFSNSRCLSDRLNIYSLNEEKKMNRKTLVILAGVLMLTAIDHRVLRATDSRSQNSQGDGCGQRNGCRQANGASAYRSSTTHGGDPRPLPPTAKLEIVNVPMNYRDAGDFITVTIKYITDTAVGPASGVAAMALTGLNNVPINMPVRLAAKGVDPTVPVTRTTWTLTTPPGSQAKLKDPNAPKTEFTPDVVGTYKVDVVLANAAGSSPMESVKIYAGTFVGDNAKNCVPCHKNKVEEWSKTGHANIFRRKLIT